MTDWTPQRPQWICTCGHTVEDHGDQPLWPGKSLWPCTACDTCEDFVEDLTGLLFDDLGEGS